eukprot:1236385-Pleurochrysis_carterae.AAC.1
MPTAGKQYFTWDRERFPDPVAMVRRQRPGSPPRVVGSPPSCMRTALGGGQAADGSGGTGSVRTTREVSCALLRARAAVERMDSASDEILRRSFARALPTILPSLLPLLQIPTIHHPVSPHSSQLSICLPFLPSLPPPASLLLPSIAIECYTPERTMQSPPRL